jgi:MFS family permease
VIPKEKVEKRQGGWVKASARALGLVFKNPQSVLCGAIAGLLFIPTTILDMIWGVRFLQEGHGFDYGEAVLRSASVPLGWMIGSPLMGLLSDRVGRRKPVMVAGGCGLLMCLAWILYGRAGVFPPYLLGLATGVTSGSAMLAYTVIKEANPPELGGTATGAISLMNFGISALAGPVFGSIMQNVTQGQPSGLRHYQLTFQYLIYGVALAIGLTVLLKETGPEVRTARPVAEAA